MSEIEKIIDDVKIAFTMWDSEYGIGDKEWESMNTAINLLKNSADYNDWISVTDKEKLPKRECIAYSSKFDEMMIGYIGEAQDCDTGYRAESNGELLDEVTHWMPKPKPPKEGEAVDEIKLKPCPLCGRKVEWRDGMIMCWCGIRFKDRNYISTVESWNKRNCCGNEDED